MSYEDELANLKLRLVTETGDRRANAERRIKDVEAAIALEAAAGPPPVPEAAVADHGDVETAMLPKAKRR